MKIGIHKAKYRHSQWYYYLKSKRLTLKCNPPIYKWLCFVISLNKQEYEKVLYKKGQTTFIYCPHCDTELISSDSFVKDTDFVYYECRHCETNSKWEFDAPTPILIDKDVKIYE